MTVRPVYWLLMAVLAVVVALALALGGCATKEMSEGQATIRTGPGQGVPAVPYLTRQTGELTIPRQDFINQWAAFQVLYDAWIKDARFDCATKRKSADRCQVLPEIEAKARITWVTVEAKLRNPEAEVDWGHVADLASLIAKFVI